MDLEQRRVGGACVCRISLAIGHATYLVQRHGKLTLVTDRCLLPNDSKLGRITIEPGGAKLQAVDTLLVFPGHSQTDLHSSVVADPRDVKYQLEPLSDGRSEIIILRNGDVITSPNVTDSVACMYRAPEVQVNSSAAGLDDVEPFESKDAVADTPGDETEDEATLDDTITEVPVTQPVTQPTKSQPSATPRLPEQRSLLVQETPTTDRMLGVNEYDPAPETEGGLVKSMSPPPAAIALAETFSTARTGQSPKSTVQESFDVESITDRKRPQGSPEVRVGGRQSKKRASPVSSPEPHLSAEGRSAKRARRAVPNKEVEGDIVQNSPFNDINADLSCKSYSTKGKRRVLELPETTPSKSEMSSQRSATATTAVAYEGEPPRVATSNSALKDGSPTIKFLRKHGGTLVASVEDKCNVLCVRDVGLAKTMKVIQAIALGIPIVSDRWLSESAKSEAFLDLSSYKPSVAQQEKDWGFDLEKVWGVAQTPFKGYTIYFTPALRKTYTNFREMDRVCQTVGAKVVSKRTDKSGKIIVLAKEEEDPDADRMVEDGETCYHKDLLTNSILRGTLDLDSDEFKIIAKPASGSRRKGPRKST
ncbi:uncharacterized protein EKO05_0007859 [Ascochyta rabiei]|uniref:Uncharacterized protein n=1 Tax=Didymella rabiei TaxID=5454 RepID=A0A163BXD2_DIDRA|nr:uncharacterized protein EKO05_0007859 [Ascochyta rabiei]KZM22068.1 hypothetical protein ST47_g6801 [Ascochyta rabiei]UPX17510.1 hypothetical protein EKO05_0007859 [Ascochyta rabiei]